MRQLLPRLQPRLDWIQVGITTHCNAGCLYCPRTVYRSGWQSRHMDPELFSRFISGLKKVGLIHLQGWGEPFVHPEFWSMLRLVKQKGFQAGCTSNAVLLDSDALKKAVDEGLDILALSLAGIGKKNDDIRRGTSYRHVLHTFEELQRIKARRNRDTPHLHLAFMLMRSNLQDLEDLPDLFRGLGVDHVVLSSLTLPPSPELAKEAVLADNGQKYRELKAKMRALFAGPELRSRVFCHLYNPFQPPGRCAENVDRALCLSVEGRVTPCVFTQLPVRPPATYCFQGVEYSLQSADFGRVQEQGLKEIWHNARYKQFRRHLDLDVCSRCTMTGIDNTLHPQTEQMEQGTLGMVLSRQGGKG